MWERRQARWIIDISLATGFLWYYKQNGDTGAAQAAEHIDNKLGVLKNSSNGAINAR